MPLRWRRAAVGLTVGSLGGFLSKELELPALLSYWDDRAPLVLGAAILGAVLWISRLWWLAAAAVSGLAVLWTAVAFTPLCLWLAKDLVRRDPLKKADAVFVLGSSLQDDGELTTVALSRLVHGLELLAQEQAPRLVLSELGPPEASYAATARELMGRLGLKQEVLGVGPVGRTRDEALAVAALFRERGWNRVLVVTSPAHSRRASSTLEREGLEVISSPSTETRFDLETFDKADDRIDAFGTLIHERLGLWVYRRWGWIGGSSLAPETR